eukprot:PhM_4_TR1732/c2_g1_i4/m.86918
MMSRHFDSVNAISYAKQQLTYLRISTWLMTCEFSTLVPYWCSSTAVISGLSIDVSSVRSVSRVASLPGKTLLRRPSRMYDISVHMSCSKLHSTKRFWTSVCAVLWLSRSVLNWLPSAPAAPPTSTLSGSCRNNVMASPLYLATCAVGPALNSASGRGSWGLGLVKRIVEAGGSAREGEGAAAGCRGAVSAFNAAKLKIGWSRRCPFVDSAKLCKRCITHRPARSSSVAEDWFLLPRRSCSRAWASNAQSSASASAAWSVPAACKNTAWTRGQVVFGIAVPVWWPTSMVPPVDRASAAFLSRSFSAFCCTPKSTSVALRRIMLHVAVVFAASHVGVWWFLRSWQPTYDFSELTTTFCNVSLKVATSQESSRTPHSK